MTYLRAHRLWLYVVIGIVALIAVLALLWFRQANTLPDRSDIGAVKLTHNLRATAEQLKNDLDRVGTTNPSVQTNLYIARMQEFEKNCQGLKWYLQRDKSAGVKNDTTVYLASSELLCNELSPIAERSRLVYMAVKPVLDINPRLKRYQTLPLLRTLVRNKAIQTVESATGKTKDPVQKLDYPSDILTNLKQLLAGIRTSDGVDYYPALADYQLKIVVEQSRYWTSYADLANLIRGLDIQLDRYCQNLPSETAEKLGQCRRDDS